MMAATFKVDSFNIGTGAAATTVAVTGVGFLPQFVFFWWSGRTETGSAVGLGDVNKGYGMAISSSSRRAVGVRQRDNFNTNGILHDLRYQTDTNCIIAVSDDASPTDTEGLANLQSMDSDGFTLVINEQFTASFRIHFMAISGLDNVFIGTITEPGATGNQDTTTPGFQPDSAIFTSAGLVGLPELGLDSDLMFGAAAETTPDNVVQAGGGSDAANGDPDRLRYVRQGECVALIDAGNQIGSGTLSGRASVTSWLSNGLRLNWTERTAATRLIFFAAFKGAQFGVGTFQSATSITTIVVSGLGFQPKFVMTGSGGGTAAEAVDTPTVAHDMWTFGMGSASPGRVHGGQNEKVASPSVAGTAVRHDSIYVHFASPPSTLDGRASLQSLDADGFTLSQDDADPSSFFGVWWAGGEAAAGVEGTLTLPAAAGLDFEGGVGAAGDLALPAAAGLELSTDAPVTGSPGSGPAGAGIFPGATAEVYEASIDQSLQLCSDQFEIGIIGSRIYKDRRNVDVSIIKIGLLDAFGIPHTVIQLEDGKIDEFEIQLDKERLVGRVRGRDAGAEIIDTALYITYQAGGLDWQQFNTPTTAEQAFLDTLLPDIPGVTRRLFLPGTWRASTICADLAARRGLDCVYQAPDYVLREDVEVNGPALGAIQGILASFSHFEPSKIDVWVAGKTLVIRQRPGLAESPLAGSEDPGLLNTFSVTDVRIQSFQLRAKFLDSIRILRLQGAPEVAGGSCATLIFKVSTEELTDSTGRIATRINETRTVRLPDNAVLAITKEVYDTINSTLIERTNQINAWDDLIFDQNCRIMNSPLQRFQSNEITQLDTEDNLMRPFQRAKVRFSYDEHGVLTLQESITEQYNKEENLYRELGKEIHTYRENGVKQWEMTVANYAFTATEGADGPTGAGSYALVSRRSAVASGFRPGGPGRAPKDTGVDRPGVTIVELIDNVPGAKDFSLQDANLQRAELEIIKKQAKDSSGAMEYEMKIVALNIPWLRRGQMVQITDLKDETGADLPLQKALVSELRTTYIEGDNNPSSISEFKALYWSKVH